MPYWIDILALVLGGGGVIYLIVEKIFMRRIDGADAKGREVQNARDAAALYNEIDEIVKSKTEPIEAKLDKALSELDTIRRRWCCYRQDCDDRMLYEEDDSDDDDTCEP